jgi:prolipoprotein diacylglyceryltransferase
MGFVHDIDPVLFEVGGVYLWYYGLSYSVGFLALFW